MNPIKNAEPEEGARIIQKMISLTPEDAKAILDVMKETGDVNGAMELMMAV